MKSLKLCETKKLHYGKYLFKLVLFNRLNSIFRTELQKEGKLSYARKELDNATDLYRKNRPISVSRFRTLIEVPIEEYLDAKDIYTILKSENDYKIRVNPYQSLIVYSNNKNLLDKIANKMRVSAVEFWEPDSKTFSLIKSTPNVIITETKSDYEYKVTLGKRVAKTHDLANWLINNTDKSKVGPTTLDALLHNHYADGLYFYVRDEKVLMLTQLMAGSSIRRVDKLVYKGDIDKY